jgi:antitoxin (DNA-binding transcriptional repressor) of toxin-antitoxin stability system
MKRVRSVGVKELKDSLSAYLRGVKEGEIVLVTERSEVIAEIQQPTMGQPMVEENASLDWAREGRLTLPRKPKTTLVRSHVKLAEGTAARILNESREEG